MGAPDLRGRNIEPVALSKLAFVHGRLKDQRWVARQDLILVAETLGAAYRELWVVYEALTARADEAGAAGERLLEMKLREPVRDILATLPVDWPGHPQRKDLSGGQLITIARDPGEKAVEQQGG